METAPNSPAPEKTPEAKKPKFTSKVRRGLALIRMLTLNACDPDKAPGFTTIKSFKKSQESDFNAAMAWMEANEETS